MDGGVQGDGVPDQLLTVLIVLLGARFFLFFCLGQKSEGGVGGIDFEAFVFGDDAVGGVETDVVEEGGDAVGFAVAGLEVGQFVGDEEAEEPGADHVVAEGGGAVGLGEGEGGGDEGGVGDGDAAVEAGWKGRRH